MQEALLQMAFPRTKRFDYMPVTCVKPAGRTCRLMLRTGPEASNELPGTPVGSEEAPEAPAACTPG